MLDTSVAHELESSEVEESVVELPVERRLPPVAEPHQLARASHVKYSRLLRASNELPIAAVARHVSRLCAHVPEVIVRAERGSRDVHKHTRSHRTRAAPTAPEDVVETVSVKHDGGFTSDAC
jgi:hypothetical protein